MAASSFSQPLPSAPGWSNDDITIDLLLAGDDGLPPQDRGNHRTPPPSCFAGAATDPHRCSLANSPGAATVPQPPPSPGSSINTRGAASGSQPSKTAAAGALSPNNGYSANTSPGGGGPVGRERGGSRARVLQGQSPGDPESPCPAVAVAAAVAAAATASSPPPAARSGGGCGGGTFASPLSSRAGAVSPSSPMSPFHVFAGTQLSPLSRSNQGNRGGGGGKPFSFLPMNIVEEQGDGACDTSSDDGGGGGVGGGDDDDATTAGEDVAVAASIGGGQSGEREAARTSDVSAGHGQAWWAGDRGPDAQQRLDDSFGSAWPFGSSVPLSPQQPTLELTPDMGGDVVGGGVIGGFDDEDARAPAGAMHRQARLVSMHSINPAATEMRLQECALIFPPLQPCARSGGGGGGGVRGDAGKKPGARRKEQGSTNKAKKQHLRKTASTTKSGVSSSSGSSSNDNMITTTATTAKNTTESATNKNQQQEPEGRPVLPSSSPKTTPASSASATIPGVVFEDSGVFSAATGAPLTSMHETNAATAAAADAPAVSGGGGYKAVVHSDVVRSSGTLGSAAAQPNVDRGVVVSSTLKRAGGGGRGGVGAEAPRGGRVLSAQQGAATAFGRWKSARIGDQGGAGVSLTATENALAAPDMLMNASPSLPASFQPYLGSATSTVAAAATAAVTTPTSCVVAAGETWTLDRGQDLVRNRATGGPPPPPAPAARRKDRGSPSSLMLSSFSLSPVLVPRQKCDDSLAASPAPIATALALTPAPSRGRGVTAAAAAAAAAATTAASTAPGWNARKLPQPLQAATVSTSPAGRLNPRPVRGGKASASASATHELDSYAHDGSGNSGNKFSEGGDSALAQVACLRQHEDRSAGAEVGAPPRRRRRSGFDSGGRDGGGGGGGGVRSAGTSSEDAKARAGGGGGRGERPRPAGKALTGEMVLGSPGGAKSGDGGGGGGGSGKGTSVHKAAVAVPSSSGGRRNKQADAVMVDTRPSPSNPESSAEAMKQPANTCTCKKCKCLKLYCDCFAQSRFCGPTCLCLSCHNRQDGATLLAARQSTLHRNPEAFTRALALEEAPENLLEGAGCGCTKSQCLKKYCVCFHKNLRCGRACSCEGCMNTVGSRGHPNSAEAVSTTPLPQPPRVIGSVSKGGYNIAVGGVTAIQTSKGLLTPPTRRR